MLSKRTIIGLIIGSVIIGLGGYSLLLHIGPTISLEENYVIEMGEAKLFVIPAPNHAPQHMEITGDAFDLKLESPSTGLQIPSTTSENTVESFKNRIDEPLTLDWVHLQDGETKIQIQNTGNTKLEIILVTEQTPAVERFIYDSMVIITGMVILGLSMGFSIRKPKGF